MSLNKIMDEFNALYSIRPQTINSNQQIMVNLVRDELEELQGEVDVNNEDFVKEAIDLIYITAQQLRQRGVDVDAALAEVHRSNLSKRIHLDDFNHVSHELDTARERYPDATLVGSDDPNYGVLKCASSNKVIKPTTYTPAKLGLRILCG